MKVEEFVFKVRNYEPILSTFEQIIIKDRMTKFQLL